MNASTLLFFIGEYWEVRCQGMWNVGRCLCMSCVVSKIAGFENQLLS